jgi:short-subunit dehydrogenase
MVHVRRRVSRVVVITGASSGIGRATALRFAADGADLVLAARNPDTLRHVATECADRGARAIVVPTDLTDRGQVDALARTAVAEFGRIDVWVGAASVFSYGTFQDTPAEVFQRVMDTNLMGHVHSARVVLRQFRQQGEGTLILVGSLFSLVGSPFLSPYVTSKFALRGFTESLRPELRHTRIRVRLILPATVDTPIYQHAANYTGRRVHPLPPVIAPRRVARAIQRAARTGRRARPVISVGRTQRLTVNSRWMVPRVYDRASVVLMNAVALRGVGASSSDGTVFSPAGVAAVSGGWRSMRVRVMAAVAVACALCVVGARPRR